MLLALLFAAEAHGASVLVWSTGSDDPTVEGVADWLRASNKFTTVDALNVDSGDAALVAGYDAVLFYSDSTGDPQTNGDVLAEYADGGGYVVVCTFAWAQQGANTLGGKFLEAGYSPFVGGGESLYVASDLAAHDGTGLFYGVSTVSTPNRDDVTVATGAFQRGSWGDQQPFAARTSQFLALNMFPAYGVTGDFKQVVINALAEVTGIARDDDDGDTWPSLYDCDDASPGTHPFAPETCVDVDENCDGAFTGTEAPTVWYADADGDAHGDPNNTVAACTAPNDHVADATDCDDTNEDARPGGVERPYDGIDGDCDPATSDNDADQDGYDSDDRGGDDCDDDEPSVYPGAPEVNDGRDNDCDGVGDARDADGDGLAVDDELDLGTDPGQADTDGDGIDDGAEVGDVDEPRDTDDDGTIDALDPDDDGDGVATELELGDPDAPTDTDADAIADYLDDDGDGDGFTEDDCDDLANETHPDAIELGDGADNDCDGEVDEGTTDGDCDDADAGVFPGGIEWCDDLDNNCDGEADEGDACDPTGRPGGCQTVPGGAVGALLALLTVRRRR